MYALFIITFDYYTWEDVICVSHSYEKLEEYYKDNDFKYPLYNETKSDEIKEGRTEEFHYTIKKVELI